MLRTRFADALMGLAVSAGLIGCSGHPQAQTAAVSASAASQAKSVGERLAEQDRENTERHRKELARLMNVDRVTVQEADRTMTIRFTVHNLTPKAVRRVEAGFEVDDATGTRLGSTEFHDNLSIAPHTSRAASLTFPYTAFGSGTGAIRESVGKPQRYLLDVKEIKYGDGSDAGYDD